MRGDKHVVAATRIANEHTTTVERSYGKTQPAMRVLDTSSDTRAAAAELDASSTDYLKYEPYLQQVSSLSLLFRATSCAALTILVHAARLV